MAKEKKTGITAEELAALRGIQEGTPENTQLDSESDVSMHKSGEWDVELSNLEDEFDELNISSQASKNKRKQKLQEVGTVAKSVRAKDQGKASKTKETVEDSVIPDVLAASNDEGKESGNKKKLSEKEVMALVAKLMVEKAAKAGVTSDELKTLTEDKLIKILDENVSGETESEIDEGVKDNVETVFVAPEDSSVAVTDAGVETVITKSVKTVEAFDAELIETVDVADIETIEAVEVADLPLDKTVAEAVDVEPADALLEGEAIQENTRGTFFKRNKNRDEAAESRRSSLFKKKNTQSESNIDADGRTVIETGEEEAGEVKLSGWQEIKENYKQVGRDLVQIGADIVDAYDRLQDRISGGLHSAMVAVATEMHKTHIDYKYADSTSIINVCVIGVLCCVIFAVFEHFTVYEYAYNGRVLGYVDQQDTVIDILDVSAEQLSEVNETEISFISGDNVTFNKVVSINKDVDDSDQALKKLTYMTDIEVDAYAIYEDGDLIAIVESETVANSILEGALEEYSEPDEGMELVSVDFLYDVEVVQVSVLLTSVQGRTTALDTLLEGGSLSIQCIVGEDDTLESLAEEFGVSVNEIVNENEEQDIEVGDVVTISKMVDAISVQMIQSGTMAESIPYDTIEEETSSLYIGDEEVSQEGVNGKQVVTGTITYVNGVEVDRDVTVDEVISEAVDEIILVGTAEKPATAASGTFAMPIRTYTISSYYGYRWGSLHEGIDFAASTGTSIYASDGGTVVRAAYYGGYGLCVDIDHGNGYVTRYGHCSAVYVSVGDEVYQGQVIAAVGSTGRSTGSHLHFEIRYNGSSVNPYSYLFG